MTSGHGLLKSETFFSGPVLFHAPLPGVESVIQDLLSIKFILKLRQI